MCWISPFHVESPGLPAPRAEQEQLELPDLPGLPVPQALPDLPGQLALPALPAPPVLSAPPALQGLPVTRGQKDLPDQLAPQGPLEPQELPVIREQWGPLALPAPPAI